jgi:hypothetical protein
MQGTTPSGGETIMSEQTGTQVVTTSTLEDALRALGVPDQAVMILAGFRAMVPKRDLLGSGWTS